jgi:hypothetical protein
MISPQSRKERKEREVTERKDSSSEGTKIMERKTEGRSIWPPSFFSLFPLCVRCAFAVKSFFPFELSE